MDGADEGKILVHAKNDNQIMAHQHIFSKLFQLCTGYGILEKYSHMRGIKERNHNCGCGQLEISNV